jgi:hypothetical protein
MTHLGHFLHGVAGGPPPREHAAFAAGYAALEPRAVERFTAEANALRAVIRRGYVEQWLERHSVDPRLAALVSGAYIATARDGESVRQILRSRGVQFADARIFHSLREKTQALESIASLESVPSSDVRLVDDSIQNCIAARDAGFEANWASWGYGAPGDEDIARSHGIRVLTVEELLAG